VLFTGVALRRYDEVPIRKVAGGYQWGQHGKVYKSRAKALKQAQAAFANGYKGK
jgi:hypothetical protein